jgi:hypothetical protein
VRVTYTKAPVTKRPTKTPSKAPTSAPTNVLCTPSIEINNMVVYGSDSAKCDSPEAVEYVEGCPGTIVTYCFYVVNTGCTHLNGVTITNPNLNFTSSEIGSLKPMESVIVSYTSKISSPLRNEATVKGNPVLPDGKDIPNVPDVSDTDPSSVGIVEYHPAIAVQNAVYIGDDNGLSCGTEAVELVKTNVSGTHVVYCFTVTNMGDTFLGNVKVVNAVLNYTDNSIGLLAPKASKLIAFRSNIVANLTNNVVVMANPTTADGSSVLACAANVTATDPSHVELYIPGSPKTGPTTNSTCIEDKWKTNHTKDLMCTTKHVYLESIKSTTPVTCKAGETVTVTVDSNILIEGERSDLGWYVAVDGGDALTGTCAVNGLHQSSSYSYVITNANGMDDKSSVVPVWAKNQGGDGDQCGDVKMDYDIGRLNTPVLINVQLPCTDNNEDGKLDASICFTWRGARTNRDECTIGNNVPGTDCACYCSRYDINNTVVKPPEETLCA